jgi:hypothetical protein
MQTDRGLKVVLWVIAGLLFLNIVTSFVAPKETSVLAAGEGGNIGKYQVSAWAAQSGPTAHHAGYYIIDTTTGQVTDSKAEIHGIRE